MFTRRVIQQAYVDLVEPSLSCGDESPTKIAE
jgi:hypothetical protein